MNANNDTQLWLRMIAILALDRTFPLYGDMGLRLAEPKAFRTILRKWLHQTFESEALPHQKPAPRSLLEVLKNSIGAKETRRFQDWAEHVFYDTDRPILIAWQTRMTRWCRDPESWRRLTREIGDVEDLRQKCLEATSSDVVDERLELVETAPLSPWDTGVYALMAFDEDENNPLTDVFLTICRRRFMEFWRELDAMLDGDARETFLHNANSLMKEVNPAVQLTFLPVETWPTCT